LKWNERIYALYKGDTFLAEGTIPEIAAQTNKSVDFIRWMTYPAYAKRAEDGNDMLVMVDLDDDEEGVNKRDCGWMYFTKKELELAKKNGLSYGGLRMRILKGMDVETAINKPKQKLKKDWDNEIYAMYKGEDLLATGTVYEIAQEVGMSAESVKLHTYPSSQKRNKGKKKILVYIGKDDEEEII